MTCTADHSPCPRDVGMPFSFKLAAMARKLVVPAACRALDGWADVCCPKRAIGRQARKNLVKRGGFALDFAAVFHGIDPKLVSFMEVATVEQNPKANK
jgi:hypothetical protein